MRPRFESDARAYLTPLATLIGLALCAAALRASHPRADDAAASIAAPPAAYRAPLTLERPPTSEGLRDLFRPHMRAAAERCGLDPAVARDPEVAVAELPLSIAVAADGRVIDATVAGHARIFANDGAARPYDLRDDQARCYAALVRAWIHFATTGTPSRLDAPLRLVDAQ